MDAAFEFITKLGAPYYCFHDLDLVEEGALSPNPSRRCRTSSTMQSRSRRPPASSCCGARPICSATRAT